MWERRIDSGELFSEKLIVGDYGLLFTYGCPQEKRSKIVSLVSQEQLNWLEFLETGTQRRIYVNRALDVIVKRKIYTPEKLDIVHSQRSVVNEIRASNSLSWVVKWMGQSTGKILDQETKLSLSVEKPYGAIINLKDGTRYVMFENYQGDSGQILHNNTEPPMNGAYFYDPYRWDLWCEIKNEIERVANFAEKCGVIVGDWDVHQTMYRHNRETNILDIHLIDADYHELEK